MFRSVIHRFFGLFGRQEGVDPGVELLLEFLVIDAGGGATITGMDLGYPALFVDKDRGREGEEGVEGRQGIG